ncbi:sulfite exporter TauE/SafE family protein [Heyndrickxia oleronia]|uniref:Probable membrane transporter protein n=1 Tax=Heyndrickxia oleronia TaxID=38875 RepID=A0AAW6T0K8_9BACI|nr:sulfite exporter TauE/SafE family protein [Heyndrickxia oleronia]MCM3239840.1 sulfite exporter TauE/SafE family protein [Heyndrickxia oleronia]MDH5162852.1 sulfite exporter TauE/SafE family protein [Heyndrickxia oleronia]
MAIVLTMLLLGAILGFVGAGGSGFIIAILTLVFKIPIHTALATSLTAMAFTSLSGAFSHYREGNISIKAGLLVGGFGAIGALIGSKIAAFIPTNEMHYLTGGMLFLSAILLILRLLLLKNKDGEDKKWSINSVQIMKAACLGIITGILSGTFGIGSTPFIQLGLLTFLGLTLRQSIGTTMLVIVPIAVGGGVGFSTEGFLDVTLLIQVLIGTMLGAYIGAKFTNLVPKVVLKAAMILTPITSGLILMF